MSWSLRRNRCRRLSGPSSTSNGLLVRGRKLCLAQLGRIVPPQFVQFRRQQRRHGSDAVTWEGKPQILMAQNQTLHGLVESVGIEMRPEREAGREPIGRIGGVETIDEPQRF